MHSQNKTKQLITETAHVPVLVYAVAQLTGRRSYNYQRSYSQISQNTDCCQRNGIQSERTHNRLQHSVNVEPPPSTQRASSIAGSGGTSCKPLTQLKRIVSADGNMTRLHKTCRHKTWKFSPQWKLRLCSQSGSTDPISVVITVLQQRLFSIAHQHVFQSREQQYDAHLTTAPQHIPTQHDMLPQHLICKYELNCEYCNITLARNIAP